MASGVVFGVAPQFAGSPTRVLILGLDEAGRIVDHDRPAAAQLGQADVVVTLQPVCSSMGLVARAIVRITPSAEERFADTEVTRRALLDAPISQVGGGLGIDEVAPKVRY